MCIRDRSSGRASVVSKVTELVLVLDCSTTKGYTSRFDAYVEILKPPREEETFSTWARNKTSEESNETSEQMFLSYVENFCFLGEES